MTSKFHTFPTLSFPSLFSNYAPNKTQISLNFIHPLSSNSSFPRTHLSWKITLIPSYKRKQRGLGIISMAAADDAEKGQIAKWVSMISPRGIVAERILRLIAGATSSPICQFVSSPVTFLHLVDPRIKLVWLLALVVLPARSHIVMRLGLVIYLALLSIWVLPTHVWKVFQSASLCLTTTTPEQLASALRWFMLPLTLIGVPVSEIILTLLLSLRFINLVFDEVRNAALGIVARRIHWRQLTVMETLDVFVMYVRRIFKNIFSHAEQISQAMIVRGFRGDSNTHKIYFFSDSSIGAADIVSLFCLLGLIGAAIWSELFLI
ncbi:protein ABCI12, chloroplastic isoform X3 [Magnolia sinica]|uniref:protein ABCI12, chloroplastic isoform X3 n=1 Tax=Magnolia sinica TaxID=86752 RepID=UPI00265A2DED|nr:protein ABCI12, chloroplastic isoform X3 [Magnolia sinica]